MNQSLEELSLMVRWFIKTVSDKKRLRWFVSSKLEVWAHQLIELDYYQIEDLIDQGKYDEAKERLSKLESEVSFHPHLERMRSVVDFMTDNSSYECGLMNEGDEW